MTIKGFYHICMINHWQEIVNIQLDCMIKSGLYDKSECIYVGAVGSIQEYEKMKKLSHRYKKLILSVYDTNLLRYEFLTLNQLWVHACKDRKFFGFYIHTKGVSFPGNEGGKYWLDYMNYYNLTTWDEARKKLFEGYDICGVKLRTDQDSPAYKLHYSGNFWWFDSIYIRSLRCPLFMNQRDRFEAEMWIGTGKPKVAVLCHEFVDYNTKGKFKLFNTRKVKNIIVHSLCWNLPSEVEKTTLLIYEQNGGVQFKHYICDLGFPLLVGDQIPDNIPKAIRINTDRLKEICRKFGSTYIRLENIGVSQNWTQIINHCQLKDEDIIIGADPDERTMDNNWINAMSLALEQPNVGMATLMMSEQSKVLHNWQHFDRTICGVRMVDIVGSINWAMIGFNGKFTKAMGDVPFPTTHPIYGYIEHFVREALKNTGYKALFLPDHRVLHTDYELGNSEGSSRLLREWKNFIIFGDIHQRVNQQMIKKYGQISFGQFLELRKKGIL